MSITRVIITSVAAIGVTIAAADEWHWVEMGLFWQRPLALEKGPDGVPQILYCDQTYGLTYGRYVNGVWQKERVGPSVPVNAAFLIDATNRPHIYWVSGTKLYYAEKIGAMWVRGEVHDFGRATGQWFDAAMKSDGNVYVVVDVENENGFRLLEVTPDNRVVRNIRSPIDEPARYISASDDGRAHIIYFTGSPNNGTWYISWYQGGWTSREEIASNPTGSNIPSGIACDAQGRPWVSYNSEEQRLYYWANIYYREPGTPPRWSEHWSSSNAEVFDFKLDNTPAAHRAYFTFRMQGSNKYDFRTRVEGSTGYWERSGQKRNIVVLPQEDNKPAFVWANGSSLEYWYYGTFTGVEDFTARSEAAGVTLSWRPTTSYAGFNLYRGNEGGERAKINMSLITGRPPFRYVDADVARGVKYAYELEAVKPNGQRERFGPLEVTFEGTVAKAAFTLGQCRPNPAAAAVTIPFSLASASAVELAIYDVAGRRVYCESGSYGAGRQELTVDVAGLAPGVYVYRMAVAGGVSASRRMVIGR